MFWIGFGSVLGPSVQHPMNLYGFGPVLGWLWGRSVLHLSDLQCFRLGRFLGPCEFKTGVDCGDLGFDTPLSLFRTVTALAVR